MYVPAAAAVVRFFRPSIAAAALAVAACVSARSAFTQDAAPRPTQVMPAGPQSAASQPAQPQSAAPQPARPQSAAPQPAPAGPSQPQAPHPQQEQTGIARWLNPASAPFIPIPEIDEDPYSGTTIGVIPTFLVTNDQHEIRQIIAPDVIYNQYFGWGARGRVFSFPSDNTQWSIVGGGKERVESEFDGEYAAGIQRQDLWSFDLSLIYDRNGSPRFYGLGNNTHLSGQTNYTDQQKYVQTLVGLNLTHAWQIGYTFRARTVDISPGHISGLPSIQELYPTTAIRAERQEILDRLSITYDSRDNVVAPTRGAEWVVYAGAASSEGILNSTLYSECGLDGRNFLPIGTNGVLAIHVALRYMPGNQRTHAIPFWALSSIGGDQAIIGGDQPLRGFGTGRFVDRDSSSMSVEYRWRVATINAFSTQVGVELTPFVDMGRVFALMGDDPVSQLHKVGGIGVRATALPFVVGYLDVGYGNEGFAIFTGLNYPF
jgi:hypothetical protein